MCSLISRQNVIEEISSHKLSLSHYPIVLHLSIPMKFDDGSHLLIENTSGLLFYHHNLWKIENWFAVASELIFLIDFFHFLNGSFRCDCYSMNDNKEQTLSISLHSTNSFSSLHHNNRPIIVDLICSMWGNISSFSLLAHEVSDNVFGVC